MVVAVASAAVIVTLTAGGVGSATAAARAVASPQTVISSGVITIPGTWTFDPDTGKLLSRAGNGIFWEIKTATRRDMVPPTNGGIHNIGVGVFSQYSKATLVKLHYGSAPIPGGPGKTNQLVNNDIFAVYTHLHHYAKVQVLSYGYDLKVRWVTYG
jgi:hypothetical protein